MAGDDNDDLYDEEFDFVDDVDDDDDDDDDGDDASDIDDESPLEEVAQADESESERDESQPDNREDGATGDEEPVDQYGRPEPAANYVVHVYEYKKFKRTIDRPFTPEDAEAFATEFNRTGKNYGRFAVSGKNDSKPKKSLD